MNQNYKTYGKKLASAKALVAGYMYFAMSNVHAALPTPSSPSQTPATGDYIGLLKGYAYDIALVIGLVLGTLAFITVAKNMISTYNEIGTGRKTWGDMGMHGGMGVMLLVFVVYLLTEASKVIF